MEHLLKPVYPLARLVARLTMIGLAFLLTGCQSAPQAGNLNQALSNYNAQRYEQSRQQAASIASKAPAGRREDAAYLAGLSAYQLGESDEAERQFLVAANSPDSLTAARSKAMLGQLRMDQRRPREAAAYFTAAHPALTGDDAKKCATSAAAAYQQSGDITSAKKWLAIAESSTAAPVAGAPYSAPVGSSFTLQVGAFQDKKRALRAAEEAETLARREGLGAVKVFPRRDERGQMMYIVQVGAFPTRDAAAAARARIGRLEYIVAVQTAAGRG